MNTHPLLLRAPVIGLLSLTMCLSGRAAAASDTQDKDIGELLRAIEELRAANRTLTERVTTLEAQLAGTKSAAQAAAPAASGAASAATAATAPAEAGNEELARRVKELEMSRAAQADATRAIIRDAMTSVGSKINEAVSLGGAIEVLTSRGNAFTGTHKSTVQLNTAELDMEVQANPWTLGELKLAYNNGGDVTFTNTKGFDSGVDRLTVDAASITVGDVQRFPLFLKAGLSTLPFGSSTGSHRADVLSIENPLTVDAFEIKRSAIGIGFGWPTPAPTPPTPGVVVPPVQPQVLTPLFDAFGSLLGYAPPPQRPKPPTPVSPPPEPPPFYGIVNFYEGQDAGSTRTFFRNVNARLGYRTAGHCRKPYELLRRGDLCPWSLDVNVDYLTSVFDSQFMSSEYHNFLDKIGTVRGMASTLKLSLGPLLLSGEWSGATRSVVFKDDAGTTRHIQPHAWGVSLGYQFDWNPWVETIGGAGTYVSLGYSRSHDLAGVRQLDPNGATASATIHVGALPRSKWTLTVGEWVLEGLKVQFEYSQIKDYPTSQGGTGKRASGIQTTLTYSW
ncbi:MAG: hypothetical protein AB9M53_05360 [Leptothrix sp. (in: b-proteobacteria)]